MNTTNKAENQSFPRVSPGTHSETDPPASSTKDRERQAEMARWALPFLDQDHETIQLVRLVLHRLARQKERPMQTPGIRDHLLAALANIEIAAQSHDELRRNTRRLVQELEVAKERRMDRIEDEYLSGNPPGPGCLPPLNHVLIEDEDGEPFDPADYHMGMTGEQEVGS